MKMIKKMNEAVPTKSELVTQLQEFLADLFTEYHNYRQRHWHVQGPNFKEVHELFDEADGQVREFIDTMGEYIVSYGAIAPTSQESITKLAKIPVSDENVRDAQSLLESALSSTQYLKQDLIKLSKTSESINEYGVTNAVQDMITQLDKLIYKYQAFLGRF